MTQWKANLAHFRLSVYFRGCDYSQGVDLKLMMFLTQDVNGNKKCNMMFHTMQNFHKQATSIQWTSNLTFKQGSKEVKQRSKTKWEEPIFLSLLNENSFKTQEDGWCF